VEGTRNDMSRNEFDKINWSAIKDDLLSE